MWVHFQDWPRYAPLKWPTLCGGLNEKWPPRAYVFELLVPSWWCFLGVRELLGCGSCWRKHHLTTPHSFSQLPSLATCCPLSPSFWALPSELWAKTNSSVSRSGCGGLAQQQKWISTHSVYLKHGLGVVRLFNAPQPDFLDLSSSPRIHGGRR